MGHRVVITGIGVISSLGTGVEQFWENCLKGQSVVAPIPPQWQRYADYQSSIWAPLPALDFTALGLKRSDQLQHDPVSLLGLCAGQQALQHAGLEAVPQGKRGREQRITGIEAQRAGVFMGAGLGGMHTCFKNVAHQLLAKSKRALLERIDAQAIDAETKANLAAALESLEHPTRFNPLVMSMVMANAVSATMGIRFGFHGPNNTYSLACASGTTAIGHAYRALQQGQVDFALAGGADYLNDDYGNCFKGFDVAKTLVQDCAEPDKANRPFDAHRSGFLFSEGGAGVLVLETLDRARQRSAPIIAEISGFGQSFDAHSMMSMAPDGMQIERMMSNALDDAALTADQIDYINMHGTGTQVNDALETEVVERLFGRKVLVNSTKSLLGHTIGASGAIEAAVTALSIHRQTTHICRNLENPIADLNFVHTCEQQTIERALTHSFAFGGHNAGLVLQRCEV